MDFETVKEALETMQAIAKAPKITMKDGEQAERLATVKDIQELLEQAVVSISDLLGMPEVYLGGVSDE